MAAAPVVVADVVVEVADVAVAAAVVVVVVSEKHRGRYSRLLLLAEKNVCPM